MTAQPYDPTLAGDASLSDGAGLDLRVVALVTVLVILVVVAAAALATVEWIAPASAGAVPG